METIHGVVGGSIDQYQNENEQNWCVQLPISASKSGLFAYIPGRDSTGPITGIWSIVKVPSNVRYSSFASGVVKAAVAILEAAKPIVRAWVVDYELLKLW